MEMPRLQSYRMRAGRRIWSLSQVDLLEGRHELTRSGTCILSSQSGLQWPPSTRRVEKGLAGVGAAQTNLRGSRRWRLAGRLPRQAKSRVFRSGEERGLTR